MDREVRGLGSGWALEEDQAAQELAAEPAGAVALARQEVAAVVPVCGSRADQAVAAARGRELVVQVVEAALAAALGRELVVRVVEAALAAGGPGLVAA